MVKYKVKNFSSVDGDRLQKEIKRWIESRNNLSISDLKIWRDEYLTCCTIIYIETTYEL